MSRLDALARLEAAERTLKRRERARKSAERALVEAKAAEARANEVLENARYDLCDEARLPEFSLQRMFRDALRDPEARARYERIRSHFPPDPS